MTTRKSRRAVMAEMLLIANPSAMYDTPGYGLAVSFDTIVELRTWLNDAGLNGPDLLANEHTGTQDDGRTFRRMTAWPMWHGWRISAHATEYTDPPALHVDAVEGLSTVAVAG
ncbi:hypothetical protein GCM10027290_59040 [Micromonospora sonneratiae]|uniref:Uncharacterized protein n=1 Tax=Micromonospora sonneratiae TaxID=1184706 RepID=A0ABW3Y6I0_9ACTN